MSQTQRLRRRLGGVVQRGKAYRTSIPLVAGTVGVLAVVTVDPVAAQPGGGQFDSAMNTLIPWVVQWLLVIGALVGGIAHVYSGWTSDPDKAFRRKEWRNRAWFGVALLIPALIVINWVVTTFGGDPLDFFPFV